MQVNLESYKKYINSDLSHNFLDFLFNQIIQKIIYDFNKENKGFFVFELGVKDVITLAIKDFLKSLNLVKNDSEVDVFKIINSLSKVKYEKKEAYGEINITNLDSVVINNTLRFEENIHIKELRRVRKLLEGTKGNFSLVTDLNYIYGFANKNF